MIDNGTIFGAIGILAAFYLLGGWLFSRWEERRK